MDEMPKTLPILNDDENYRLDLFVTAFEGVEELVMPHLNMGEVNQRGLNQLHSLIVCLTHGLREEYARLTER